MDYKGLCYLLFLRSHHTDLFRIQYLAITMYSTVTANTRRMNSGMAYWMQEDMTVPAGPYNAHVSSPLPTKKGRLARFRNFLRLDANTNDHARSCKCIRCLQVRGKLNIQVIQEPPPSFSPGTPRRAPTPPRRRNSSPQIRPTTERPMAKRFQTEVNSKALPVPPSLTSPLPGAPGHIPPQPVCGPICRKPLPPGVSVFVPTQSSAVPGPPVSPISPSALYTHFDSAPISPISPPSPAISSTASEPDFDQARINRMSTYSYLDGYNTDLSAFATTPFAETFAAAGVVTPITLTRASSTAVNGPAIQGFVLRTATPVSFQKAKPVNVRGPVRNPSDAAARPRAERPKLTLQIRSVHVNRPEMVRNPSINSVDCVAGSESSSSNASIAGASDTFTDNSSLGSHARILKRVLVESLEARSLIRDSFVPK
jgi:hypothetical protein